MSIQFRAEKNVCDYFEIDFRESFLCAQARRVEEAYGGSIIGDKRRSQGFFTPARSWDWSFLSIQSRLTSELLTDDCRMVFNDIINLCRSLEGHSHEIGMKLPELVGQRTSNISRCINRALRRWRKDASGCNFGKLLLPFSTALRRCCFSSSFSRMGWRIKSSLDTFQHRLSRASTEQFEIDGWRSSDSFLIHHVSHVRYAANRGMFIGGWETHSNCLFC